LFFCSDGEQGSDVVLKESYRERLQKIFRESDESFVKTVVQVSPERERQTLFYNNLVLAFAQVL